MCVVDIDTGAALRLPLSVGPATHYQPLTGQATPSATHFRFPQTNKVRFPAWLEFGFVQGGGIWISQGGISDLPPPRGVGWSVSNLLGGNPGGREEEKSARLIMSREDFSSQPGWGSCTSVKIQNKKKHLIVFFFLKDWAVHCIDWRMDCGGICRKQTWFSNLVSQLKDIWWKRNPADLKSGANQNRSDQKIWSLLLCTHWTLRRIIPSLPLTCYKICTMAKVFVSCLEAFQEDARRCRRVQQPGKYMYAGGHRLKLQLDRSIHLFRSVGWSSNI